MKNILKYISLLFLGAAAVSCNFEDMPFDKYDSAFVFSNDKKAEGYVLGVYLGLPFDKSDENGYNRVDGAMLASASDEAMITVPGSSIVFLTDGSLTPRKSNPDGCWENNYKFIRDANIGIVGLEKLPEANHDLKLQLQAELTNLTKSVAASQSTLNRLKVANDEEYNRILSSINLEEIKRIAIMELGMVYAQEGQIIEYENESGDYMRQVTNNN